MCNNKGFVLGWNNGKPARARNSWLTQIFSLDTQEKLQQRNNNKTKHINKTFDYSCSQQLVSTGNINTTKQTVSKTSHHDNYRVNAPHTITDTITTVIRSAQSITNKHTNSILLTQSTIVCCDTQHRALEAQVNSAPQNTGYRWLL
jgi:hypothetical protein